MHREPCIHLSNDKLAAATHCAHGIACKQCTALHPRADCARGRKTDNRTCQANCNVTTWRTRTGPCMSARYSASMFVSSPFVVFFFSSHPSHLCDRDVLHQTSELSSFHRAAHRVVLQTWSSLLRLVWTWPAAICTTNVQSHAQRKMSLSIHWTA